MNVRHLINPAIPVASPGDRVGKVLHLMQDFHLSWLPVVEREKYLGMISEEVLLNADEKAHVKELPIDKSDTSLTENQHFMDVFRQMSNHHLPVLPVLNDAKGYVGSVGIKDAFYFFGNLSFFKSPGGILVLSMPVVKYSLAELSRLAESDGFQIICVFIHHDEDDPSELLVTIKFNRDDLSRIMAAYERFGYQIEAVFHETDFNHVDAERLSNLFRYLNI